MAVVADFEVGGLMDVEPSLLMPDLTAEYLSSELTTRAKASVEWRGAGNKV